MLDLKALLSKILNLLKGDNGDWTSISSDYLECSKRSGIVTIMGFSSGQVYLTAGQWNNIATLPSGYRPKKNFSFVAFNRSQIQPLLGQVTTGGIVRLYCDTGQYGSYWMFNASFPVVGGGYLTSKFSNIFSHLERRWKHVRFEGSIDENIAKIGQYWNSIHSKLSHQYYKRLYRFANQRCIAYPSSGHLYTVGRMALHHTYNDWHDKFTNCISQWRKWWRLRDGKSICKWQQLELTQDIKRTSIFSKYNGLFMWLYVKTDDIYDWNHKLVSSNTHQITPERGWCCA